MRPETPQDYGRTRGGIVHYVQPEGSNTLKVLTPQTQPKPSRDRSAEAPDKGGARFVGVGAYTLRNSQGVERQALRRYDRKRAREYLANIGR